MKHHQCYVSASVVVLNDKNEILLVKNPQRGWEIPGGHVDEMETIADAAAREVKEESGIEIEIVRFCGLYHNYESGIINFLFLGTVAGGALQTSEESLEVGFYPISLVETMVTWKNFYERICKTLNEENPFLIEFGYKL